MNRCALSGTSGRWFIGVFGSLARGRIAESPIETKNRWARINEILTVQLI